MILKNKKKEINLTISRKLKKRNQKLFYISIISSTFYSKFVKYNSLKYFMNKYSMNLNCKMVNELCKEEIGFVFSLSN